MGVSSHARARLLAIVVVDVVVRLHVVVSRRGTRRPAWRELRATTGGKQLRAVAHGGAPAAARPQRRRDGVWSARMVRERLTSAIVCVSWDGPSLACWDSGRSYRDETSRLVVRTLRLRTRSRKAYVDNTSDKVTYRYCELNTSRVMSCNPRPSRLGFHRLTRQHPSWHRVLVPRFWHDSGTILARL